MVSNAQRMHESLTNVEALWVEKDTISNLEGQSSQIILVPDVRESE